MTTAAAPVSLTSPGLTGAPRADGARDEQAARLQRRAAEHGEAVPA